jgi:3',5'-cyclic AMP phosphodiesterase CpdA
MRPIMVINYDGGYKMKPRPIGKASTVSFFNLLVMTVVLLLTPEVYATDKTSIGSSDNPTGQGEYFSFVVWGHPKTDDGLPALHFEEILDRISELSPDFLVITGDVINGMWGERIDPEIIRSDFNRFDEGVKRLGIPVYRLPGNHDVHNFATRDIYLERYPKVPYAFTYKGSRFIMLDTIGINQRTQDGNPNWKPQKLPFDDTQLTFIRNEVEQQDKYNHVFFFMHHVWLWRNPSGFWWKDVHPMLKDGKTRVVFSGTLGNPGFKYDHVEQDNIHYIGSCTFRSETRAFYRSLMKPGSTDVNPWQYQPDNVQFVRVEGGKYTIRTIVVGEWESKNLSSRFWYQVWQPLGRRERLRQFGYDVLNTSIRFSLAHVKWVVGVLFAGAVIGVFWQRRRLRKSE